jgi:multiple sugar transport system substrate-binding protein
VPNSNKHDPLDPLEEAYSSPELPEDGTGPQESEVFHGSAIVEEESGLSPETPPPPPPISPAGRFLRILPFIGGLLLLLTIVYFGFRFVFRSDKGASEGKLTYWVLWEEEEVLKPLIEEFQKKNPKAKVEFVRQTPIQYRERLEAHIARGEGPDIFRFHNTWVPMLREELAPLPKNILKPSQYKKIFYPVMVEDLEVGGKIVGIPLMFDGLVMFYNEDIFNAGGFTTPASDWNSLLEQAEALTVKDANEKILTSGAALGRADNIEHFSDILGLLLLQNGANPAKPDSEAGVTALEFYRLFSQAPDNVWGEEFDNDIIAFAGGKVAIIFAPSWEAFTISAMNPNLKFKTAPVPQVAGAQLKVTWASYWVEGVNSRSSNQKLAWEFLKFLSEKESLEKFFELTSKTRKFGEPYPRKDLAGVLAGSQYLGALVEGGETAKSFYMASRTFDNGINDRIIQYYRDAVNSLDEGNSPQSALDTASKGISQVLQSFNVKIK